MTVEYTVPLLILFLICLFHLYQMGLVDQFRCFVDYRTDAVLNVPKLNLVYVAGKDTEMSSSDVLKKLKELKKSCAHQQVNL